MYLNENNMKTGEFWSDVVVKAGSDLEDEVEEKEEQSFLFYFYDKTVIPCW